MAHLSSKFVLKRARALRKVQESVKRKWAWDEKSLADWDGAIQGVEDQQAVETNSKAALNAAHSRFISEYRDLRARTLQELGMLKNRHRNDSIKLARLAALRARGGAHQSILDEALALQGFGRNSNRTGVRLKKIRSAASQLCSYGASMPTMLRQQPRLSGRPTARV
jgi:hypothetical protein